MGKGKNKLIYGISDIPKTVKEIIMYALQQVLSVIVATVLISQICNTPVSSCLFGACVGTLIYQVITKFKSPMFISSCGATCSAVIGALALNETGNNYLAVSIGGLVILAVYSLFALIVKLKGINSINSIFPPVIVGSITIVIGVNLASFIPTYVSVNGEHNDIAILVSIFTMLVIAISSHYFKGFLKTIPFLIGIVAGYIVATILTLTNICNIIDFTQFNNIGIVQLPDFTFNYWNFNDINGAVILKVVLMFLPVAICALLEHYSDHVVLSNIIGTDLTETPGLHRTLLGDGVASFIGTITCGLPNTSYGESIATTGFSKVASTFVISVAAIILGILSFFTPVQVAINSIPACVFGGASTILYGYIAASGLRTLINSKVDFGNNKNLIVSSVILTVGVSGIWLFDSAFTGVALAMILGVILNLILRDNK